MVSQLGRANIALIVVINSLIIFKRANLKLKNLKTIKEIIKIECLLEIKQELMGLMQNSRLY